MTFKVCEALRGTFYVVREEAMQIIIKPNKKRIT
ncbi:hypothetical protein SAMN05428947_10566 [Mucilaginibacter sp. OK283]|jgi:hypothetical protein|nr:hypothetical protein SAMN05428947_10566 [Mucilaginibacter sp. OK283]